MPASPGILPRGRGFFAAAFSDTAGTSPGGEVAEPTLGAFLLRRGLTGAADSSPRASHINGRAAEPHAKGSGFPARRIHLQPWRGPERDNVFWIPRRAGSTHPSRVGGVLAEAEVSSSPLSPLDLGGSTCHLIGRQRTSDGSRRAGTIHAGSPRSVTFRAIASRAS